jgi:exodeoxyribonuclease V gamma subunit
MRAMTVAPMLIVHRSNRIEALVDALAEIVVQPLRDPFAPEWVAVQGRGMGRWLAMELARRLGVWANPSFPFPRKVIDMTTASVLGAAASGATAFDPETLHWAIAEALPQCLGQTAFEPIRGYLRDDSCGAKRFQLAGHIADRFDQYAVYRPQMVLDWENDDGRDWQAELWRTLVRTHGPHHPTGRAQRLLAALAAGRRPGPEFPRRLSLFGLSTLPPLYIQILAALADSVELHLFVLSPSRAYRGDVRSRPGPHEARPSSPQVGTGEEATRRPEPDTIDGPEVAEGHPLLTSLGRVGRDFQRVLEGLAEYQEDPHDRYVDPGEGSMLAVLQSDILGLRSRGSADGPGPAELTPDDDSIAVHACHGSMREVEVLHDQLLALFDRDHTLEPHHVVVMTPAIDAYAPAIDAVFRSPGRPPIPFRIADRSARAEQEVADAFLRALELLRGRLPAAAVLDLLALAPIRARFGIAVEELERLRCWVAESGIRWGADAAHRAESGQPACDDNTWRFGLDRLLLGYALPGRDALLFGGVLPYDDVEGADATLLGRFAEFCATLCHFRTALRDPRHPVAWRDALRSLLGALTARTSGTDYQHQAVGAALEKLAECAVRGGFTGAVELDVVRTLLEREIERGVSPHGFLTGAVTFCEMVPMRTIPFRVVCLLGLNDGAFPRARRPLGFDHMAARPLAGDRTARDDDRYLFLEALLAAREHLIVTYVGQSISDNSELPPSVVVNELLDAIDRSFADPSGRRPRDRIVLRHALQPFSPCYFGHDPAQRLFSYARPHHAGAAALVGPQSAPPPFLATPLAEDTIETVSIDALVRFFDNPSRWFLQHRLGVYLGRDAELLADREPLELDALDRWRIGEAVLGRALDGDDPADAWAPLRAGGLLPLGTPGRCAFDEIAPRAAALAQVAGRLRGGDRLPPEDIDLPVAGVRLTGALSELWPGGQIAVQYAKLGGRHELRLWIRHLVRSAARAPATPSVLVGRPTRDGGATQVWFGPIAEPQRHLAELLRLFRLGQTAPLPFFPMASRAFADALRQRTARPERAWDAARRAFAPDRVGRGDAADPYVRELYPSGSSFGTTGPVCAFSISIADTAKAVFDPFFRHRELRT